MIRLPTDPARFEGDRTNLLVNLIAEGRVSAVVSATSAPTTGSWAPGDFVRNSNPSEGGSASSKYVILGWVYTSSGFKECRCLTGA